MALGIRRAGQRPVGPVNLSEFRYSGKATVLREVGRCIRRRHVPASVTSDRGSKRRWLDGGQSIRRPDNPKYPRPDRLGQVGPDLDCDHKGDVNLGWVMSALFASKLARRRFMGKSENLAPVLDGMVRG